jgi:glutamate racemase
METILGPGVAVLDSGEAIARQVRRVLDAHELRSKQTDPSLRFITTAESPALPHVLERLQIQTGAPAL